MLSMKPVDNGRIYNLLDIGKYFHKWLSLTHNLDMIEHLQTELDTFSSNSAKFKSWTVHMDMTT